MLSRIDLFEAVPAALLLVDAGGMVVDANSEAIRIFGSTRDELVGHSVDRLVPPEVRLRHPALRSAYFASPEQRPMGAGRELRGVRHDGSEFPVEIGLRPIAVEQQWLTLAVVVDITERRRAEERLRRYSADLERSNRDLDQFAYSASHDLRAPLRAAQHLASWIAADGESQLSAQSTADLATLQQRLRRMDQLLEDLLQYSRVGRTSHAAEMVDICALLDDMVQLLAPPPEFQFHYDALPTLRAHRVPLEQVFRNLLQNSLKHRLRDDGRVEVAAHDAGDFVEFAVRDDGPGIPPEYHTRVFKMFQTLKPRDEVEGSGMGLALVKKLVETQGGAIVLDSRPGQGATFRFTWPRKVDEA